MDYSASIHDADHPAGASPWGSPNASPQHNRTSFTASTTEPPPAFGGFGAQSSSNGLGHDHDEGGFGSGDHSYRRPDTASTADTHASDAPPEGVTPGQPAGGDQQQVPEGHDAGGGGQPAPGQPAPPSLSGETAVPSGSEAQTRRPAQPQFKLQVKITGLERTGRKDPILRFDVHVRENQIPFLFLFLFLPARGSRRAFTSRAPI